MTRPLTLWLLGDGKPGHENQSLGLAEALGRVTPCAIQRLSVAGRRGVFRRINAVLAASAGLPAPDLIIGAGHATHLPLWWLARKHRAKSIVLMRPSLPLSWFDLCIVPAHDFPAGHRHEHLLLTRGALNRVAPPARGLRSGRMILLGGPSKIHGWDGASLVTTLAEITADGHWTLTDSRRTPAGFLDHLRQTLPSIKIFPHQDTPPEWLPERLGTAEQVWVTEDSVSMIYEALSSGAEVGLLPAPRLQASSRVLRGIEDLIACGFLTPLATWQQTRSLSEPPETLREADRCAEFVIASLI